MTLIATENHIWPTSTFRTGQPSVCEVTSSESWKLREKPSALALLIYLRQIPCFLRDGTLLAPDTASAQLSRDPRTVVRALNDLQRAGLIAFEVLNACPIPRRRHPGKPIALIYKIQPII